MKTFIILTLALLLALGNLIFLIPSQNTSAQGEPVANPDSATTNEDTQKNVSAPGVLSNDLGSSLSVTAVNGNAGNVGSQIPLSSGALLTVNTNGSYNYNPNEQFESLGDGDSYEDSFNYTVSNGTGSDTATVTITITGVNDPPSDITLSNDNVDENMPAGTTVGSFDTVDPDGDIFTYSLVPGTGDADNSSFSIEGDELKTAEEFDRETKGTYSIRVKTDDGNGGTCEEQFTITINNINDNPPVITNPEPISFDIAENSTNGTLIGTIAATDLENNITAFTITAGNSAGVFAIDATGQITVADSSQLDFETTPQYNLTIVVEDSGNPPLTDTADITINVTDVNDPPVASDGTAAATEDGDPVSSQVPTPTDQDSEINPNGYALVDDLTPEGILTFNTDGTFTFDPGTGFQDLSQGQTRDETFTYTASDTEGAVSEPATVTITVTGVNDIPTDIALDNDSVDEHKPTGTIIGTFSTTDLDIGDSYTYTLAVGEGDDDNGCFTIGGTNGNELQTGQEFDFETRSDYSIRVKTTDSAGASFEKQFTIDIIDGNDPPTGITLSGTSVPENAANGIVVGTLSATDSNPSDTHTFSIYGQEHDGAFIISGNEIRAGDSSLLDHEADSQHMLNIKVTDSGGLEYTHTFTINITDVNEPPVALDDNYSVIRGNSITITAPGVLANDNDPESSTLSGTITNNPGHAGSGFFTFDSNGGFSYTNDGSAATTDSFTYKAYDGTLYSNIATVTITITDPVPPTLTIPTAATIKKTSAKLGATVTSDGGAAITARGVVWSTTANPTLSACSGSKAATGTTGVFTVDVLTGLQAGTTYHYRGFATNSAGTGYTQDSTFSTAPELSNVKVTDPVNEGASATLSGSLAAAATATLKVDWGDGLTNNYTIATTTKKFTYTHKYEDNPASGTTYTIALTLTDSNGTDTASKSITVKNVAPTAEVSGSPNPVDEGKTFTLTIGSIADPGKDTVTEYTVWWDNITSKTYKKGEAMTNIYNEAANSVFIRVYITDEDGSYPLEDILTLKVSNVVPTAKNDKYTTYANSSLHKYASEGLLINDENPANEDISIISVDDDATDGKVTWKSDGSFTYDPNGAYDWLEEGDTRTDTFAYTIKDDDGSTNEAIVTITVKGYTPSASKTPDLSIYFVNAIPNPGEGGSVSLYPAGGSYLEGTQVSLMAIPEPGYTFTGWSGDLAGTANPQLITIDGNINATANFSAAAVTLLAAGSPAVGTPTETGTGMAAEDEGSDRFNPWVVIGPILGVGAIVAIARIERMGGLGKLHKSWTRTRVRGV